MHLIHSVYGGLRGIGIHQAGKRQLTGLVYRRVYSLTAFSQQQAAQTQQQHRRRFGNDFIGVGQFEAVKGA